MTGTAADMVARCARHQWPEASGRPDVPEPSADELPGTRTVESAPPDQGDPLPPTDPGYPGFEALP